MRPRKILIITDEYNPDADAVILRLRELGEAPMRLNLGDFPGAASFSLRFDGSERSGRLTTENRELELDEVASVFWHRPGRCRPPANLPEEVRRVAEAEIDQATNTFWSAVGGYWLNPAANVAAASWRPAQLRRAAAAGFVIPRTLISSQPDEVMAFFEECGRRMLFKPMGRQPRSAEIRTQARAIRPALIQEAQLRQNIGQIANAPCQFQEQVEIQARVRVIMVEGRAFVATNPQPAASAADGIQPPQVGVLPPEVETACRTLMTNLGLGFAVIDLVRTSEGKHFFMEIDPEGSFHLLERQLPGWGVTDAIAASLLRGRVDRKSATPATASSADSAAAGAA